MPHPAKPLNVLFLCTGNSCRSQMAEAWARTLAGDTFAPYSAGVEVHGVNPNTVRVMEEAGVDMTGQTSKHLRSLESVPFDIVVTVCDNARESCPVFSGGVRTIHQSFPDPAAIERTGGSREDVLGGFRAVRDQILDYIFRLRGEIREEGT